MLPILSAILPVAETVIDRLVPDKNAKKKAMIDMEKALIDAHTKGSLAQLEINKVEAASRSVWVSGWRACCGWVAAFALGFHFNNYAVCAMGRLVVWIPFTHAGI